MNPTPFGGKEHNVWNVDRGSNDVCVNGNLCKVVFFSVILRWIFSLLRSAGGHSEEVAWAATVSRATTILDDTMDTI